MEDQPHASAGAAVMSVGAAAAHGDPGVNEKHAGRARRYYEQIARICIEKHRGRPIPHRDDHLLATFPSVETALHCAGQIQREIQAMNRRAPALRRMEFCIGISLQATDAAGDVALGLKDISAGGRITISGDAREQISDHPLFSFVAKGDVKLPDGGEPVSAHRVTIADQRYGKGETSSAAGSARDRKLGLKVNLIVMAVIGIAALAWFTSSKFLSAPQQGRPGGQTAASIPDRPALAVLPIVSTSATISYEQLGDEMTRDLIAALETSEQVTVISHDRILAYRGIPKRFKDLGRELGVQYVVEGRIRKTVDSAQLYIHIVDTEGRTLWRGQFDRDVDHLPAVKDEIVARILAITAPRH
jgi:adenylate cyclase